jgi:hypothetical protein
LGPGEEKLYVGETKDKSLDSRAKRFSTPTKNEKKSFNDNLLGTGREESFCFSEILSGEGTWSSVARLSRILLSGDFLQSWA